MDIIKSAEWEGEPLYNMLSEDEKAFADSLLKLSEELGPLDQSEGIWIGYEDGSTNQNASIGVKCGNCALHKSAVACAIISQQIEEEGACRLAVIPDGYVNADMKNSGEEFVEMNPEMSKANNIGSYFEIPVTDMERAISFYQTLLGIELEQGSIDEYEMAFFPYENNGVGISGALVKGDVYKPSIDGVFLYLKTDDIDLIIRKAVDLGSEILLEKTKGDSYFVAEIKDSEGNRICFKQDFSVNVSNDGEENIMNDDFDMSKADSVRVGQMVSWNSSGGTARGKVVRVVRNGSINVPNSDFTITGTPDNPAALIRIYRDGKPTDTLVGHRVATLSISSSKSHDGNDDVIGNDDVPNKRPHSMEECNDENCPEHNMGKKDYSDKERQMLARRDMALPDGSFPIVTAADLSNAVQSVGRSSNYARARNHIIRRAEALNRLDLLPEEWKPKSVRKDFNVEKRDVSDIDLKPTEAMASNAKRGLELRNKFGRGGTAVGVARARDLSNRTNLSPETVARMYSFFSRHEVDKQGKDWDNAERPSNGKIAWLLWGGDSGFAWSTQKWEAIQNARASKSDETWKDSPFSFYK